MNEILTKFKPGRRLDAMVAMALGWQWVRLELSAYGNPSRWLDAPVAYSRAVVTANQSDPLRKIHDHWSTAWWGSGHGMTSQFSNINGIAFEAALEAGVLELRSIGQYEQSGVDFFEIDDGDTGVLAIGETAAHCLCLGILAIQPEDKLAEWESWLPEEVE